MMTTSKIGLYFTAAATFLLLSCQTTKKEPLKLLSFDKVNPFEVEEFEFTQNDEVILNAAILKKELTLSP